MRKHLGQMVGRARFSSKSKIETVSHFETPHLENRRDYLWADPGLTEEA